MDRDSFPQVRGGALMGRSGNLSPGNQKMVPKAGIVNSYNLLLLRGFSFSSCQSANDLYNKKSLVAIPNIGV